MAEIQNNPQNDESLSSKHIASKKAQSTTDLSDTRNRVLKIEESIKVLFNKINEINNKIKVVKKVTKDRKGNTIIVVEK